MAIPNFLVSTRRKLLLVENGQITNEFHYARGILYGITWDAQNVYVASRNGGNIRPEVILKLSKDNLELKEKIFLASEDWEKWHSERTHQITYNTIDGITLTNTHQNKLTTFDGSAKLVKNVKSPGITAKHFEEFPEDSHINSIWTPDGILYYVVEHRGKVPPSSLTALTRSGDIFTFRQRWNNIGMECHNIHIEPHETFGWLKFTTLSSKEFSIKQYALKDELVDGATLQLEREKVINALGNSQWYVRGLARIPGVWLVGLSRYDPARSTRLIEAKIGGVIALDDNWNTIQEVDLSGNGMIYDLRIISSLDECHNGIPW
jgi:hypothetical protein